MALRLTAATGAALLGADARLLAQEYRRVLATPGSSSPAPLRLGFRELLYFQVMGRLSEEGLQLSPSQKREVFRVFTVNCHRLPEGFLQQPSAQGSLCSGAPGSPWPWW